jgi:antitoxin component YwqK of YwqJK toxin-antitoxin module
MKSFLFFIFCFFTGITTFSQAPKNKILYVIDSIPLLNQPEPWNQILQEDIADYSIVTNKDSLKMLRWEKMDGIAYVFTKEYRKRPDSVKRIPSLKQMVLKDQAWMLNGSAYTGRYIDYYNNGKKENEGTLLNGKIDGELTVYYKSGITKSITHYRDGIRNGTWIDYYKNGALMRKEDFLNGKDCRTAKSYFINGQIKQELKLKNGTAYDTSVAYYSTGKVRRMTIRKPGHFSPDKKQAELNYYNTMFFEHLREGDIKAANKDFYKIRMDDSTNIDRWFKHGLLFAYEFRFDRAIAQFDKALAIEPLMRESLEQRGLARIKRFKFQRENITLQDRKDDPLVLEDMTQMPGEEQAKACADILLADDLDPGVNYNHKAVPETILNYCKKKSSR